VDISVSWERVDYLLEFYGRLVLLLWKLDVEILPPFCFEVGRK